MPKADGLAAEPKLKIRRETLIEIGTFEIFRTVCRLYWQLQAIASDERVTTKSQRKTQNEVRLRTTTKYKKCYADNGDECLAFPSEYCIIDERSGGRKSECR
jgi:hypothetical protein